MNRISVLHPPAFSQSTSFWGTLHGDAEALAIARMAEQEKRPILLITPDQQHAHYLWHALNVFCQTLPIHYLPDWETLPYDRLSPHSDIISERLLQLYRLQYAKHGIFITSITTLMHRLPPKSFLNQYSLCLSCGDHLSIDSLRHTLVESAYQIVNQVTEHGQCAIRGSIIDIYPSGSALPYRIDLFDETIDSIRCFDPNTQRSQHTVTSIELLPAREFPLTQDAIEAFRNTWRDRFVGNPSLCPIYQAISEHDIPEGIEYYLPLFFPQLANLFDYLPPESGIIACASIFEQGQQFWETIHTRYDHYNADQQYPLVKPDSLFISVDTIKKHIENRPTVYYDSKESTSKNIEFACQAPPHLSQDKKTSQDSLQKYIKDENRRYLFCITNPSRRELVLTLLRRIDCDVKIYEHWDDFLSDTIRFGLLQAPLVYGMHVEQSNISIIVEAQLFKHHIPTPSITRETHHPETMVRDLTELSLGAPVVHIEYGIGRYLGLTTLNIDECEQEFITLEYAESARVYVPVGALHFINRYTGIDIDNPPLHKLGSDKWDKEKQKALKKIHDVAAELLNIHAQRATRSGLQYTLSPESYAQFSSEFPFAETLDQKKAIDDVLANMCGTQAMDRLICGDVGFGKTEVAMRATFVAVHNEKQVALLVPTTLLANQHYETFCNRFANYPINIALLSRARTSKEQKNTLEKVAQGHIDILIGTHTLLRKDMDFKNLGLIIIDEEHRFGVRQKEYLKTLRAEIDILSLTATPIPRTLNLAMSGMRDVSLIATPPERRLSIKTFWHEKNNALIRDAVLREILRGGQIFYLHNNVASIERTAKELEILIPEAVIKVAHGKLPKHKLEAIMSDFCEQRCNILVCTTIIEMGIDIPNANTIIIEHADRFGLAQLHQLRGRVGRSHHQAYAYLLTPDKRSLSSDAKKRLQAILSLKDLGAGFTLATHDLEIRGAGELLGTEQSGHIQAIGFTLYVELLERTVASLKSGQLPDMTSLLPHHCTIDLGISALIPTTFIDDVHTRLVIYKRISQSQNDEQLSELKLELDDRFGTLPESTQNLFAITHLKLQAEYFGIKKISCNKIGGKIIFHDKANVEPQMIIKLLESDPQHYKLHDSHSINFHASLETAQSRLDKIAFIFSVFAGKEA